MSRRTQPIRPRRGCVALLAALVLAGCGKPASRHAHTVPAALPVTHTAVAAGRSAPAVPEPAGQRAALQAVAVARAFTAAICPYDWRDPVPYGTRLNAALARWGTAGFAAAHTLSPARTAAAAAGLVEHQAEQECGQVTGGLDPESDPAANPVAVRLSVAVTDQARGSTASTAQEVFQFQLMPWAGGGWRISSGHW